MTHEALPLGPKKPKFYGENPFLVLIKSTILESLALTHQLFLHFFFHEIKC